MKSKKLAAIIALSLIPTLELSSCGNGSQGLDSTGEKEFIQMRDYFDDDDERRQSSIQVGGKSELSLEIGSSITLENEKVRLVLNENGSIQEYVNKESKLYFVKDSLDATPIRLDLVNRNRQGLLPNRFTQKTLEDTSEKKTIQFTYEFTGLAKAICKITLEKNSDEVQFRVALQDLTYHGDNSVLAVEYPIVENIATLGEPTKDVYATPFATGYEFHNPTKNFNDIYGLGIGKSSSLGYPVSMSTYPSGWGMTMQFSSYYSENLGGFYWSSKDGGDTIKNFTFTGMGDDKLRMSVYHHVDDLSKKEVDFDYDTVIANLKVGKWEEAAQRYKTWSQNQKWVTSIGKAETRTDVNKKLFEDTSLSIFGFRPDIATWVDMIPTYDVIASRIEGDILNVAIYQNKNYFDIVREYHHSYSVFEFNTISPLESFYSNTIINSKHDPQAFSVNGTPFYYQCPSSEEWLENRNIVEQGYFDTYGVEALYFDVFATAVHPIECFDENHAHGAKINILDGFYHQLQNASDLADKNGFHSVGAEMITERTLQYIDFYQARANAGPLGWMEHDEIRGMVENNIAEKIPMFDRVYHEFGAVRMDGYLVPIDELGDAYYYIAGYTALNGGLNEFNYEYFAADKLPSASKINFEMVDYVNRLAQVRRTFGKDYMVYGEMLDAPNVGSSFSTYDYFNPNYNPNSKATTGRSELSGSWSVEDVVTAAYKNSKGNTAIFLTNTKNTPVSIGFVLKAMRDYGMENADVYLTSTVNHERRKITDIKNGTAKIGLNLMPHQAYMLELIERK